MTQPEQAPPEEGGDGELKRLVASARDALTDDMVTRLSATAAEGLDLLDRVNRSGVADALPTLAQMVKNGDLERLASLARLMGAAEDALTDDMVTRLAETVTGGLDLLDRVNRSGIARALPAISQLVENGDLDRLVDMVRVVASAQDALSDDIVSRLALIAGELISLVDRLARNPRFFQLIDLLSREQVQTSLVNLLESLDDAARDLRTSAPAKGGVGAMWSLVKDPGTQETLRFASAFGQHLRRTRR